MLYNVWQMNDLLADVFDNDARFFAEAIANGRDSEGNEFSLNSDTAGVYVDKDGTLISVPKWDTETLSKFSAK